MLPVKTIIVAGAALLLPSGAWGQTSRTFHLNTAPTVAAMNEISTIIRTLGAGHGMVDTPSQTITVVGNEAELELAAWLVGQLNTEQPQTGSPQYTVGGNAQDIVRILYLVNTPEMSGLNEMVTSLRVICDTQRIFTYSPLKAIAVRTTPEKAQLSEWVVQQLDVTPDSHTSGERYGFAGPGGPGEVVEVAFLKQSRTPSGLNEAVTVIRTATGIHSIFTRSNPQGIVFRGSTEQVQSAEKLLQQIDAQ
jgi:hypothetical protein